MFDEIAVRCEHTRLMDPNELRPHPQNPNKHPKNQIRMLVKSIKAFGWRHPIVISSRSGYIVAGHARQQAAIEMGCQVPVDVQDFDSDESELAVLLADNILQELSEMDHKLFLENREILINANIELDSIGIPEIHVPDFGETDENEQPGLDEKKLTTCPECGHVF